jgi:Lrp/AsnC family leucine-responsive transcriptional regulator
MQEIEIDKIDRGILSLLQKDAKMKIKEIAHAMDMTTTPIFERIKKLENSGIINSYRAIITPAKLGFQLTAFCTVTLKDHHHENIESLVDDVRGMPEVMECYHIAGLFDYLLKIMVKDMEAYQKFITTKLANTKYIARVQSSFVMTEIKKQYELPSTI